MDKGTRRLAVARIVAGAPTRFELVGSAVDDVFEVGSISKAITGMLLADAESRGELALTDVVASYLPELADRPIGERTVGELASHRSGLPRLAATPRAVLSGIGFAVMGLNPYVGQDVSFVIRAAGRARLREIGTKNYSNLGGALAGAVLARATGSSYSSLVQERIARPLGMVHTSAEANAPRRSGHSRRPVLARPWRMTGYAPAGGVTSTVGDLALLADALLSGTAPGVGSITRDDCFWVREPSGEGDTLVWHNGMTGGYAAYLGLRPEIGRAVVVLAGVADMDVVTRVAREVVDS